MNTSREAALAGQHKRVTDCIDLIREILGVTPQDRIGGNLDLGYALDIVLKDHTSSIGECCDIIASAKARGDSSLGRLRDRSIEQTEEAAWKILCRDVTREIGRIERNPEVANA